MAIRKKTKYLVRFFLTKEGSRLARHDQEYCGKNLQECIGKLGDYAKKHVKSFTIYVNGDKVVNMPIELYGKLA